MPQLEEVCRTCNFFKQELHYCLKYKEPLPMNIHGKTLQCEKCKEDTVNESTNNT